MQTLKSTMIYLIKVSRRSCPETPLRAGTRPVSSVMPTLNFISNVTSHPRELPNQSLYPDDSIVGLEGMISLLQHIEPPQQVLTPPQQPVFLPYQQQMRPPPQQLVLLQPQQHLPPPPQQPVFQQPRQYNVQVCNTSNLLSQSLFPTQPQSEVVFTYQENTSDREQEQLDSQGATTSSIDTPLAKLVQQLIICSSCTTTFNRAVVCHEYLIQLNRPVQCVCGCVKCTLCYRSQGGCCLHNIASTRGAVNTTSNTLASCSELENLGEWDLKLQVEDHSKADGKVDRDVQQMMYDEHALSVKQLRVGRFYLSIVCLEQSLFAAHPTDSLFSFLSPPSFQPSHHHRRQNVF